MWAIILPILSKYWLKIVAAAALVGGGLYAGLKIMGALNKGKIDRVERREEQATAVAQVADQAVKVEKAKGEQIRAEVELKEKGRQDEQAVQDADGDDLVDLAKRMFDDTETD